MKRFLGSLWVTFFVVACGQQSNQAEPQSMPAPVSVEMSQSKVANDNVVADSTGGAEQSLTEISEPTSSLKTKYIALRHYLQIETPAEKMQASFDAAVKHCEALNCQMLSANYNRATSYNPPSASMSVRVPPRNVQIFLTGLAKNGEVLQHGRDSEDKTNQVVDTDARIQNLTHLRDRLRGMLNDKTAKFKDIIDVERELANTQAQLDSMTSLRKVLSQETDLVAVNIDFVATQGIAEQGFFAPVARAFKDAGRVMMESFGALITFVVSLIPWLFIGIPLLWLMIRLWKKLTFKKT
jgi:Domain of unknown function (DUF4349)